MWVDDLAIRFARDWMASVGAGVWEDGVRCVEARASTLMNVTSEGRCPERDSSRATSGGSGGCEGRADDEGDFVRRAGRFGGLDTSRV